MREAAFAVVLILAATAFVIGVALLSIAVSFMVAGVLFAAIGWLVLSEDGKDGGQ